MVIKKLLEKYSPSMSVQDLLPTVEDFVYVISAKQGYEKDYGTEEGTKWQKKNFTKTPWGMAWNVSPRGKAASELKAARYLMIAAIIEWPDLESQLKRTVGKTYGWTKADVEDAVKRVWKPNASQMSANMSAALKQIAAASVVEAVEEPKTHLSEDIEKHDTLNPKLFTEDKYLKEEVRDKVLEIVNEFIEDLNADEIEVAIRDIILIGSNVSYNYTKDSDLDIHIVVDSESLKCPENVVNALYSAYRSLFNKKFDIDFYGIPVELYVETENSARVSNGVYSVTYDKWIKEPEITDIPELDKEAFDELYQTWEAKCEDLIKDIKDDKLGDETRVVGMIEDIYELRKAGIAEGEYSIQNLVFKELRNNKFLDDLKEYKNELIAKRLSLEESFDARKRRDIEIQLTRICGTQPLIQANGMFSVHGVKPNDAERIVRALRQLDFIEEVHTSANGKYDFSNTMNIAMGQVPARLHTISGTIKF